MRRRLLVAAALASTALATPRAARAQVVAARFEIDSVADSTFTFRIGRLAWVTEGTRGIAVDPARREALVARFRVLGVRDSIATALVTGATTALTREHVLLITPPEARRNGRRRSFLFGTGVGVVLGAVAGFLVGNR